MYEKQNSITKQIFEQCNLNMTISGAMRLRWTIGAGCEGVDCGGPEPQPSDDVE